MAAIQDPAGINQIATFIAVADDCPVDRGTVPPERGNKPTVAGIQLAMLRDHPYSFTSEQVIFEGSTARRGLEVARGR